MFVICWNLDDLLIMFALSALCLSLIELVTSFY